MFFLIVILTYTIPNIYLFFRIKSLFITKKYRIWFILIYLLLFISFPVTLVFEYGKMNLPEKLLAGVTGYLLPILLYIFLFILAFDIFLLLNLLIRFISSETRKRFSFRLYTFSSMIILSVVIVTGGIINLNTIQVSPYRVTVSQRQSAIDHLKIAYVADFHINQNTKPRFVRKFVKKIAQLKPDIMLFGGDLTEGTRKSNYNGPIESALRTIQTSYGSHGVFGNHEYYGNVDQRIFYHNAGIELLFDSVIRIDDAIYLAGRDDQHVRQRKTVGELLNEAVYDLPVVLLDHRPTQLQQASLTQADIQFSGHTHNGQLFPINYITKSIYELSWGYKKIRHTSFFVTSGLRLWGPPVKTAGKSEIMLVEVEFK